MLCLNVTAGIGVLGQASAMIQEMFPGRVTAVAAAGFVGLLSLFNMGGRFFWASPSDFIGRKNTYFVFFVLGARALCAGAVYRRASAAWRCSCCASCVIISMYGGGFATIPAYLRDMFGTRYVGAIHGRLLTAWSMAGVLGPVLVNYIREYQSTHGVPKAEAYNMTMYIMAGLLVVGFFCNFLVRAVDARFHMKATDARARNRNRPSRGPGVRRNEHGKRKPTRHDDTPTRYGMGLRRHSADARALADADQRDELFH